MFSESQVFLLMFPLSFLLVDLGIGNYYLIYAGVLFQSLGLAGIVFVWNLGSIHFAKNEDSAPYQAVHVALTGVRGFFGPLLSYLVFTFISFRASFILAMVFFAAAMITSRVYYSNLKKRI